jgi:hypothetical protein
VRKDCSRNAVFDDTTKFAARYGSLAHPRNTVDICANRFDGVDGCS